MIFFLAIVTPLSCTLSCTFMDPVFHCLCSDESLSQGDALNSTGRKVLFSLCGWSSVLIEKSIRPWMVDDDYDVDV